MSVQDPKIWGKYYWYTMKSIACTANLYDKAVREKVVQFFDSLQVLLPCEECSEHYKEFLQTFPIEQYVKSNKQLMQWVSSLEETIKNVVAQRVAKPRSVRSAQPNPYKTLSQMKAEARAFKQSRVHRNNLEALEKSLQSDDPSCCGD